MVLVNNLIVRNGTVTSGAGNCKCGLGDSSAGSPASIRLKNNMFFGNGPGATGGSGLRDVNDIDSPDDVLDAGDSGNITTTGHANNISSTATGLGGCTFGDCGPAHVLMEIFDGPSDFRLRPLAPAIDTGLASFVDSAREWVPALDFEGDVRPQGPALDIGFNEAPVQTAFSTIVPDSTLATTASAKAATSLSWNHTVSSGTNRLLIVGISLNKGSSNVNSVTFNAIPLTQAGTSGVTGTQSDIWYLVGPPSGTFPIAVTLSLARQTSLVHLSRLPEWIRRRR